MYCSCIYYRRILDGLEFLRDNIGIIFSICCTIMKCIAYMFLLAVSIAVIITAMGDHEKQETVLKIMSFVCFLDYMDENNIDIEFLQDELLLTGTLIALILLLIVNLYGDKFKKYEVVDTNGAITLMDDDDLIIIDVREEKERSSGFIKSDIHIPMAQVKAKLDSLDKSKNILTYCSTGTRSNRKADPRTPCL